MLFALLVLHGPCVWHCLLPHSIRICLRACRAGGPALIKEWQQSLKREREAAPATSTFVDGLHVASSRHTSSLKHFALGWLYILACQNYCFAAFAAVLEGTKDQSMLATEGTLSEVAAGHRERRSDDSKHWMFISITAVCPGSALKPECIA